jgi:hypothetical protein
VVFIPGILSNMANLRDCGVIDCIRRHEQRHIYDFNLSSPRPCLGAPDGYIPAWRSKSRLNRSELFAYGAEIKCLTDKLDETCDDKCRGVLQGAIEDAKEKRGWYEEGNEL